MAWNELDASGNYFVCFRFGSKRFKRSLKTGDKQEADDLTRALERTIRDVERGRLAIPENGDIVTFLLSDGRAEARPTATNAVTLKSLFDAYFAGIPEGSLEKSTIAGMKIHRNHLERHFGQGYAIRSATIEQLQGYVASRKVSGATSKKELVTLRTVWNWGVAAKMVQGPFPGMGLKYPKTNEKPPFMPFAEVDELTKADANADELWESVFLTVADIQDLLKHVANDHLPFVYPMFCFAAHTGARRSEILRARLSDVDLKNGWVTLRERKKSHGQKTTRRVPISAALHSVLAGWVAKHPGGQALFCHSSVVTRSKKRSLSTGFKSKRRPKTLKARNSMVRARELPPLGALTKDEAHNHFKRALAGSKWERLKGWHVLRHSFISALAAKGVDQRIIDDFVGHCTEQQRRRYRHLIPSVTKEAIASVFG